MNKIVLTAVMSALIGLAFGAGLMLMLADDESDYLEGDDAMIGTIDSGSSERRAEREDWNTVYTPREFEESKKEEQSEPGIRRHSVSKASKEAIRTAIAKIKVPLPKRRAGVISGIVLDEAGKPMPDIELSVKRSDYESPPAGENTAEQVERYLQRVRWEESSRQYQKTSREGRFQFANVGEGKYQIEIKTEGLRIVHSDGRYIRNLEAGADLELSLRELALMEIAVKLPSGAMADRAEIITVDVAGNQRTRKWFSSERVLKFDPGFLRVGARIRGDENFGSGELQEVSLSAGAEPLRVLIKVEAEPTLRGKVVFQKGFPKRSVELYYMRLDGGEPSVEDLQASGKRFTSEGEEFNTPLPEAGRYAIAAISRTAGLNSEVVIAQVNSKSKDVTVKLDGLKRADYLEVDIRGPEGASVLRPRLSTSLRYEKDGRERSRRGRGGLIRRTDGKCWVEHPVLEDGEGTIVEAFVRVDCEFGTKKVPYRMSALSTVRVDFDDMATLDLQMKGYKDREMLKELQLDLRNADGYRVGGNVGSNRQRRNSDPQDVTELAAMDGAWFFAGLQPGDYKLTVKLGGRSGGPALATAEFTLGQGRNRETIDLPPLFDLTVELKNGKARRASIRGAETLRSMNIPSARFDDQDIAVFKNLQAGEYTVAVKVNGSSRIRTIHLPGTEKIEIDGNEGRSAIVERCDKGSRAYIAGIRKGDVIVQLNGQDMKSSKETNRLKNGPRGKEVFSLTLERDGRRRTVSLNRDAFRQRGRPFRVRAY